MGQFPLDTADHRAYARVVAHAAPLMGPLCHWLGYPRARAEPEHQKEVNKFGLHHLWRTAIDAPRSAIKQQA
jgi:hypothetical protein